MSLHAVICSVIVLTCTENGRWPPVISDSVYVIVKLQSPLVIGYTRGGYLIRCRGGAEASN